MITEPMDGARLLLECLRNEGVQVVFGYPGGATLPIYDALYSFPDIKHILVRHEQGAAHMADGYARATGRVGVCMATSGPGATNLVTGIATAYMDSIPMVAITGQVKRDMIGNDAFQEADVTGICRPVTKHCYLVKKLTDLPRVIKEAFHLAHTGRPGPVLVDLPRDVQAEKYTGPQDVDMDLPGYQPRVQPDVGIGVGERGADARRQFDARPVRRTGIDRLPRQQIDPPVRRLVDEARQEHIVAESVVPIPDALRAVAVGGVTPDK